MPFQLPEGPEIFQTASLMFIQVIIHVQSHLDPIQESRMSSKTPWRTLWNLNEERLLPVHIWV